MKLLLIYIKGCARQQHAFAASFSLSLLQQGISGGMLLHWRMSRVAREPPGKGNRLKARRQRHVADMRGAPTPQACHEPSQPVCHGGAKALPALVLTRPHMPASGRRTRPVPVDSELDRSDFQGESQRLASRIPVTSRSDLNEMHLRYERHERSGHEARQPSDAVPA